MRQLLQTADAARDGARQAASEGSWRAFAALPAFQHFEEGLHGVIAQLHACQQHDAYVHLGWLHELRALGVLTKSAPELAIVDWLRSRAGARGGIAAGSREEYSDACARLSGGLCFALRQGAQKAGLLPRGDGGLCVNTCIERLLPALDAGWRSPHDGPLNGLMACIQMVARQKCQLRARVARVQAAAREIAVVPVREYVESVLNRALATSLEKAFTRPAGHVLGALTHAALARLHSTRQFAYAPQFPWRVVVRCPVEGGEQDAALLSVRGQSYPSDVPSLLEACQRMQGAFD